MQWFIETSASILVMGAGLVVLASATVDYAKARRSFRLSWFVGASLGLVLFFLGLSVFTGVQLGVM